MYGPGGCFLGPVQRPEHLRDNNGGSEEHQKAETLAQIRRQRCWRLTGDWRDVSDAHFRWRGREAERHYARLVGLRERPWTEGQA